MRIVRLRGEKKRSELVSRLFVIRGPGSRKRRKQAQEALLKANPFLSDLRKLPEGTVIVVPDLPEEPNECADTEDTGVISREVADHVRAGLDFLKGRLGDVRKKSQKDTATAIKTLKSRKVRNAANRDPELKKVVEKASARAAGSAVNDKVLKDFQEKTIPQIQADFDELAATFFGPRDD